MQDGRLPLETKGVWATREGQAVVVNSTHSIQATLGDKHLIGVQIHVDFGRNYLGVWGMTHAMDLLKDRRPYLGAALLPDEAYGKLEDEDRPLPVPQIPDKESDYGDLTIEAGPKDAHDITQTLKLTLTNSEGATILNEKLTRVAELESISFDGSWKSDKFSAKLVDDGQRHTKISGEFEWAGKKALLRGTRAEARGSFKAFDTGNREIGQGWIEWAPSPECVGKLKEKKTDKTDRLLIWFKPADGSSKTGVDQTLARG